MTMDRDFLVGLFVGTLANDLDPASDLRRPLGALAPITALANWVTCALLVALSHESPSWRALLYSSLKALNMPFDLAICLPVT